MLLGCEGRCFVSLGGDVTLVGHRRKKGPQAVDVKFQSCFISALVMFMRGYILQICARGIYDMSAMRVAYGCV